MTSNKERTKILTELQEIGNRIRLIDEVDMPRRRSLFQRGREIGIFHRELGEACGISESAVIKELRKPDD